LGLLFDLERGQSLRDFVAHKVALQELIGSSFFVLGADVGTAVVFDASIEVGAHPRRLPLIGTARNVGATVVRATVELLETLLSVSPPQECPSDPFDWTVQLLWAQSFLCDDAEGGDCILLPIGWVSLPDGYRLTSSWVRRSVFAHAVRVAGPFDHFVPSVSADNEGGDGE
jgi:hypothetical protein